MTEETTNLKLFPLGAVLFPGLPLPLHIFEERYRQMIAECLEDDEPFGIVYTEESQMRPIGCSARIEDIVKRYDDGRLDIVTRGERRFRVLDVHHGEPYITGTVSYLDELDDTAGDNVQNLLSQAITQLGRLANITGSELDLDALFRMDPERASYLVAGLDAFSPPEKQHFLEMPTTSQRLLACVQSLANVVQAYDLKRDAHDLLPEGRLLHRFN